LKGNSFLLRRTLIFAFFLTILASCGNSPKEQSNPAIFWLIGALVLFFLVILLVLFLLRRSRGIGKDLEALVKERTSALAFETSKLQAVIDSVPDILFCKDTDYKYTQCNAPFEQFLGVKESQIVGKSDRDGAWFHPDDMKMIHEKEKTVISENKILIFEEMRKKKLLFLKTRYLSLKKKSTRPLPEKKKFLKRLKPR